MRLQEIATGIERDGLPDERQPRGVRRAGGLVPEHEEQGPSGAARANGGQRAEPRLGWVDRLDPEPGNGRRSLCEPGGGDHVRWRVDKLARGVRPARNERCSVGHRREVVASAADHEALDAARPLAASPAAGIVAADDRTFGQSPDLVLEGDGEGHVEGPRNRPAPAGCTHRPRRCGPQPVEGGLERDDSERSAIGEHDRDRIGIRHRALRSAQLRRLRSRRDRDEIGADRARAARGYLDLHVLTRTNRLLESFSKIRPLHSNRRH